MKPFFLLLFLSSILLAQFPVAAQNNRNNDDCTVKDTVYRGKDHYNLDYFYHNNIDLREYNGKNTYINCHLNKANHYHKSERGAKAGVYIFAFTGGALLGYGLSYAIWGKHNNGVIGGSLAGAGVAALGCAFPLAWLYNRSHKRAVIHTMTVKQYLK